MFLTASLEPGRCGVGDYTTEMARRFASRDADAGLLAFRDRHIASPETSGNGDTESLPTWRLPFHNWGKEMGYLAQRAVSTFDPDWLCLQVSPYGLGYRGILRSFPSWFRPLRERRRLMVMYHELWIGDGLESPVSDRVQGWLQRRSLVRLNRLLAPEIVCTSNALMAALLETQGIAAAELPLPSGVRLIPRKDSSGCSPTPGIFRVVLFGKVLGGWDWNGILGALAALLSVRGERLELLHIGRNSPEGEQVWKRIENDSKAIWRCRSLGAQAPEDVSRWLQVSDLGLAVTPLEIIGKSSAVSAYRAHGLPVLCVQPPLRLRSLPGFAADAPHGVYRPTAQALEGIAERRFPRVDGSDACPAERLLGMLESWADDKAPSSVGRVGR